MAMHRHYSSQHLKILRALKAAGSNIGIAEGPDREYVGRPSWWTYIKGIELHTPTVDIYDDNGDLHFIDLPNSLREFLSDVCLGNIDSSISVIDKITKEVAFIVDISREWELLEHLQMTGGYLRDIRTIVRSSKHRPERYVDHDAPLPAPSKKVVDILHTDSARVIGSQLREFPQVKRMTMDRRPIGPGKPNFLVAGYCLVCHRICDCNNFYCHTHRKSLGLESDIKKAQRMINDAFKNLGKKLPFERSINTTGLTESQIEEVVNARKKEWGISKEKAFRDKCYILEGWAKHRPEHSIFYREISKILAPYSNHGASGSWEDIHLEVFNSIIPCTKTTQHMKKTFHSLFSLGKTPKDLQMNLLHQVFRTDPNIDLSPAQAITMLHRMSQINLIKMASTKTGLKSLQKTQPILDT